MKKYYIFQSGGRVSLVHLAYIRRMITIVLYLYCYALCYTLSLLLYFICHAIRVELREPTDTLVWMYGVVYATKILLFNNLYNNK